MNDALGMNHDLDRFPRDTEQPVRLDDLEALVHHGGRVDRNLSSHAPFGMSTSLLGADTFELGQRRNAERAARRRQQNAPHAARRRRWRPILRQALKNRVVLTVDRQQNRAGIANRGHEQRAGEHQRFLVGEQDALACLRRGQGGLESRGADDRGDHGIDLRQCRHVAEAFDAAKNACRQTSPAQFALELLRRVRIPHRGDRRAKAFDQSEQGFPLPTSRQRADPVSVRMLRDDVERRRADRAGGTQYGNISLYGARAHQRIR